MTNEIVRRLQEPSARGLADAVNAAIREGAYSTGDKLPPIRDVAKSVGMSPTTVAAAWSLLSQAGAVVTDGRRGTSVLDRTKTGPQRTRHVLQYAAQFDLDLSTGLPDPALLPDLSYALKRLQTSGGPKTYLDEPVIPDLLEVLHRDWPYEADLITLADGALDAVDLVAQTFVRYGDPIGVERLSDPPTVDVLEAAGAALVPIDVDQLGATPASMEAALTTGAKWLFLQPRAHHPTGASWTPERAQQLAAVLRSHPSACVVELDFSGAIASSSMASLGAYAPDQVVHIRAYSASHGPELRTAAVGGPTSIMHSLIERRHLGQGWTSRLLQSILLSLLTDEHSTQAIELARLEYARRRNDLIHELARCGIEAPGADGIHVHIPVASEAGALVTLASNGIGVSPGAPYSVDGSAAPHIVVTSGLIKRADLKATASAIAQAAAPRLARLGSESRAKRSRNARVAPRSSASER